MNLLTFNWYGDMRLKLLGLVFTLTSAFTCAWRDFTVHAGEFCLLWVQLSFWNERSGSLKQKVAGIRLRVCILKFELFHYTILPLTNWHWHYRYPWRRKTLGWLLNPWNAFVWKVATRFVDRRYNAAGKLWRAHCDENYKNKTGKFVGIVGNQLLEYR